LIIVPPRFFPFPLSGYEEKDERATCSRAFFPLFPPFSKCRSIRASSLVAALRFPLFPGKSSPSHSFPPFLSPSLSLVAIELARANRLFPHPPPPSAWTRSSRHHLLLAILLPSHHPQLERERLAKSKQVALFFCPGFCVPFFLVFVLFFSLSAMLDTWSGRSSSSSSVFPSSPFPKRSGHPAIAIDPQ